MPKASIADAAAIRIDTGRNRTIAFSQPALFCKRTMRYTATSGNATEHPPDSDMARKAQRLFTIGYEQTPPNAVLDELENAGVKLLVDVRAVVSSRRPGFSKNQLAAALDERGIAYIHMKGLGTPKEGRLAARSGDMKALERIYARHLKTPQAKEELDELSSLVMKAGPVCLLCYERDHAHCHRKWVAEIVEDRDGVTIENLLPSQL
jgi:hypothetical protein